MADPRSPPPARAPDAPPPSPDAPAPVLDAPAASAAPPVAGADARARGVSRADVFAFLALESTQDRIRQVVRANLPRKTPRDVAYDIVQNVTLRAVERAGSARSPDKLRAWISQIARNVTVDHFRRADVHAKWQNRGVDVEELPPEPADAPDAPDDAQPNPWMLGAWLEKRVARHEGDRQTYALIVQKAREEKTYEQLAAERGVSVTAVKNRVHEFKNKYLPLRRRYEDRRDMILLVWHFGRALLLGTAAVAVVAGVVMYLLRLGPFRPAPRPASLMPERGFFDNPADDVSHPRPPEH